MAASYFEWPLLQKRPDLSNGELHLPSTDDWQLRFVPPVDFSPSTAVTHGDARDEGVSDHREIVMELRGNWGQAAARQLNRAPAD